MTERYGTEPVWKTALINEFAHDRDTSSGRRHADPYAQAAEASVEKPTASDVASVLGLPVNQVTPEMLTALAPLLAELDRLRREHEHTTRRLTALQLTSDRHSVVPCLNRRAFIREVDSFLRGGGAGMVAVLHAGRHEILRQAQGLTAGEGALRHVCAVLLQELRQTDVLGCVGGSDFAVLLPGCDPMDARVRMARVCVRINDPPFRWMGQPQALTTLAGYHQIGKGEDAETALAAADRNLRGIEG